METIWNVVYEEGIDGFFWTDSKLFTLKAYADDFAEHVRVLYIGKMFVCRERYQPPVTV